MRRLRLALACTVALASGGLAVAQAPTPILIPEWHVVGPFESGSREGLVHHLAGADGRIPRTFTYEETYPSVLADGGRVAWKVVAAERDARGALTGTTKLELEGVGWDARQDEWGGAALLNTAYASASFALPAQTQLLLEASKCVVVLDGVPIAGDPYGQGIAQCVVHGSTGPHDLVVVTSGFGPERAFDLRLTPVATDDIARIVERDVVLPDVLSGGPGRGVAGVPIISGSDAWQGGITVEIIGGMAGTRDIGVQLAPLASLKVAVPVTWETTALAGKDQTVPVTVTVKQGKRVLSTAFLKAAVRDPAGAHVETFMSRLDGSAQQFGVLPPGSGVDQPLAWRPSAGDDKRGLILSLHGAGVDCLGQARSYSQKDWAYVVAPTNRRTYGFDWHDWGALDASEVLDLALARYPIDPDRVHLSGHSMGGHGTWAFGTTHAALFASVAPSAGWGGYDSYLPTTLRRSTNFAPEELSQMYIRAIAPGRASTALENLVGLPVYVLQGGADDNVPPTHGRLLSGELERLGADVTYREVPGQGHWWDVDKERPGADCVDSAELEAFWKKHLRPHGARRVTFECMDPDMGNGRDWVAILEQRRIALTSRIEAAVPASRDTESAAPPSMPHLTVATRNVARFSLDVAPALVAGKRAEIDVDGQPVAVDLGASRHVVLARDADGSWRVASVPARKAPPSGPSGLMPGSFKKAMFEPFVVVVGTIGRPERTEHMLDLARSLALAWWVRANGTCPIVRDTDVTGEMRATRNLVLLGGPEVNAESKRLAASLALVAGTDGVKLAGRGVAGSDLACVHWQPSPDAPSHRLLVFQATTPDADMLLGSFNPVGSGQGWPDFVVATTAVRLRSWAGFAAAGWWDPHFGFDPDDTWTASELR